MRIVTWQQQQGKNSYRLIGGAKKQKKQTNQTVHVIEHVNGSLQFYLMNQKKQTNLILEGIFKEKLMGHIWWDPKEESCRPPGE